MNLPITLKMPLERDHKVFFTKPNMFGLSLVFKAVFGIFLALVVRLKSVR
jgi:hypothetical protein